MNHLLRRPALLPLLPIGLFLACGPSPSPETPPSEAPTDGGSSQPADSAPSMEEVPPARSAQANAAPDSSSPETAAPTLASTPPSPPPRCPEGMVLVPGGSYTRAGADGPKELADFCLDVLETTVSDYQACVEAGECTTDGLLCSAQSTWQQEGKENHPLVCAVFEQAETYCAFRQKRLPTLEEWEWEARGGDEGRTYPWGDAPPDDQLCWTGREPQTETCPVGSFDAGMSKHGVRNMGGNVLEFTTSDADSVSPVRIAKGGAWNRADTWMISNNRLGGFKVDYRCGFLGIRCALPARPEATSTNTASSNTASTEPASPLPHRTPEKP